MDFRRASIQACVAGSAFLSTVVPLAAQTAPSMGAADTFAVVGATTVTNTGPTVVRGDVGLSPGTSVTGFPPGVVVSGTIHAADVLAQQAQDAMTTVYNQLSGQLCTADLSGQDLGGLILTPGVYCFTSAAQLTGTLTLNAQGNPSAVFVFKTGSTLTTASNSSVLMGGSGENCNVFWQVGSSATLGTNTTFAGNVVALSSITMTTGARVFGRALARSGAVTLDSNEVDASACAVTVPPPTCPTIVLSPATLPNGTLGSAYNQTIVASGGVAPYVYTIRSGAPPAGLSLSPSGVLSGVPTTTGTASFTARATDANGCFVDLAYSVTIPVAVPTLAQWAMILLALLLVGAGVRQLRRRSA